MEDTGPKKPKKYHFSFEDRPGYKEREEWFLSLSREERHAFLKADRERVLKKYGRSTE